MSGVTSPLIPLIYEEAYEAAHHVHTRERWVGDGGDPTTDTPLTVTPGNDVWGAWVQLFGPASTPIIAGMVKFDLHRILVADVDALADATPSRIQIAWGAGNDAGAAFTAGQYTELMLTPFKNGESSPQQMKYPRTPAGYYVWVRNWVFGVNAGAHYCFFGVHEYAE